jgi:hypothetical protein
MARLPLPAAVMAVLLLAGPMGGCNVGPTLTVSGAIHAGSLITTGKLPEDHLVGLLTDMDCSAVRFEQRRPWCVPHRGPAPTPPYCTRSIGSVDCWTSPPPGAPARGVADPGGLPAARLDEPLRPWGSPN